MPGIIPETDEKRQVKKLKYLWRSALVGSIAALSGVFALCVYDAHTRLNEDWCDCAKYGAMISAAFSHVIVIAGALAGILVFSIAYLLWLLYQTCLHSIHKDANKVPH